MRSWAGNHDPGLLFCLPRTTFCSLERKPVSRNYSFPMSMLQLLNGDLQTHLYKCTNARNDQLTKTETKALYFLLVYFQHFSEYLQSSPFAARHVYFGLFIVCLLSPSPLKLFSISKILIPSRNSLRRTNNSLRSCSVISFVS